MRPCEIRSATELAKLRQIDLTNIIFLSVDCAGVIPTKHYISDPEASDDAYAAALNTFSIDDVRSSCTACLHFDLTDVPTDLHIAILGHTATTCTLIPCSDRGTRCMTTMDMIPDQDIQAWQNAIEKQRHKRKEQRTKLFSDILARTSGITELDSYFVDCINCHNCMRVCPICYCRQCFFDSPDATRLESEQYFDRAMAKGGITLPADKLLFHLGRMSHMSLSCIGCGSCEDACAMEVPVAQIFMHMADRVQQMFDYTPGKNVDEPIPALTYKENELHEYEDAKE
jgi:formate dehydrogenase subunit beta